MNQSSKILETALLAGTILMESNAEAYRTEETMNFILQTADLERYSSIALTTSVFAMVYDQKTGERETAFERIRVRDNNLDTISRVNEISRAYTSDECSVEEAYERLQDVRANPRNYATSSFNFSVLGICMLFSILWGGTWKEFLGTGLVSLIYLLIHALHQKIDLSSRLALLIESGTIAFSASFISRYIIPGMSTTIVTLSSLILLVPGIALIVALRDIFREDFISGTVRLVDAIYQALMIALGTIIAYFLMGGFA